MHAGRYAEAVDVFQKLLAAEPGMTDVWQMYGDSLMKLGREEEALAALTEAARLSPGEPAGPDGALGLLPRDRQLREARRHAEAAGDAGTTSPHENLARIALVEGDLDARPRSEARLSLVKYPCAACRT